jgi:hypothetical protein
VELLLGPVYGLVGYIDEPLMCCTVRADPSTN